VEQKVGPLRVMLVDDHALVRSAVRQAISASDVELVGEAATAAEALALAPVLKPDILLLDIDLPGMNGVQLVQELAPRLPMTRIVMLTVSSSERDLIEAVGRGAAGYLTKDLSPEALLRTLRGTARGELAMSRRFAARALRHFVETAKRGRPIAAPEGDLLSLSPRENDVLAMLADGLTDREIANALTISPRTVETHVSNILHKLSVRNRAEAAQRYRQGGGPNGF
jgi:two-component system nitrate/nitrite response regulator NarL